MPSTGQALIDYLLGPIDAPLDEAEIRRNLPDMCAVATTREDREAYILAILDELGDDGLIMVCDTVFVLPATNTPH